MPIEFESNPTCKSLYHPEARISASGTTVTTRVVDTTTTTGDTTSIAFAAGTTNVLPAISSLDNVSNSGTIKYASVDFGNTTTITTHSTLPLSDIHILQNILSFVGHNQYRFVAAVNQDFRAAYLQTFPNNKQTCYNASTVEHATICLEHQDNIQLTRFTTPCLCNSAVRHGNLPTLVYLRSQNMPWGVSTTHMAAKYDHLQILQYLHTHGCPWDEKTCMTAASNGNLEILQWLQANGCPWDETSCHAAAAEGHLTVLQWAHANGCPWNESTFSRVVNSNHLDILQWSRANDCPWNGDTCYCAAMMGNIEVLQWALANHCPGNEYICETAATCGNLILLQWAHENGCPWGEFYMHYCNIKRSFGNS
jgi:hypothetical protein